MRVGKMGGRVILALVVIALGIFSFSVINRLELETASESALRKPTGYPQLVSIEELPDPGVCLDLVSDADFSMTAALREHLVFDALGETSVFAASQGAGVTGDVTRPPVRTISDTDPIYVSVAVNTQTNEVVLQDTNI